MISIKSTTLHLKDYAKTFIIQEKFDKGCCLQNLKSFDKQGFYAMVKVWLISGENPKSQKFFYIAVCMLSETAVQNVMWLTSCSQTQNYL